MPPDNPAALALSGDAAADALLAKNPLALLIGMVLDQQVPIEWAFKSPHDLEQRLGGRLDPSEIAALDPSELARIFTEPPALHRFPASMARRVHELCRLLVDEYEGEAERVWTTATTGEELVRNVRALPGFGEHKARVFVALLGKQLGVTPPGWTEQAGEFAEPGTFLSVADIDGPASLAKVRDHKRAMKRKAAEGPGGGRRKAAEGAAGRRRQ